MAENVQNFAIWEVLLHAFLNSFPYFVLAIDAFIGHWRFSKKITILLLFVAEIAQLIILPLNVILFGSTSPVLDILLAVIHVAFFFAVVKDHLGKLIFAVLVITNLGTTVLICSKCLEGLIFPELALLKYHYTYLIITLILIFFFTPLIYLLIFKDMYESGKETSDKYIENKKVSGYMWHYLWIIPAIFYLIWNYVSYSGNLSSNENRMNPINALFLLCINAGSILIYRMIIKTVKMHEKNTALLAENHVLSIQRLQYDSLNERLDNMRRTRHDLRHYTALLTQIRDNKDFDALDDLINMYTEKNLLNAPLVCCENETVNVILALYSETAHNNDIKLSIKANIPKNIFVDQKDISVLFGNILENATHACKEVKEDRFINLNAAYTENPNGSDSITLVVKNNYAIEPSESENGIFRSTKHSGDGIGISSVRSIAEKYKGASTFTHEDGTFTVSVILYQV
ncbi:MAG: sensor histidine kinase [Lachnospiraceae bacterium]|nr:sensor histidine kinase [Lachnospiraceae bacterium]